MSADYKTRAYWVVAAGRGELRSHCLPKEPPHGQLRIRARYSAISVGTERLVGCARVPAAVQQRMRCPGMDGSFSLPLKYGYCLVGEVLSGARSGEAVFALNPHEEFADIAESQLVSLPAGLPMRRATLYANLETAVNAVWDAQIQAGARVLVLGLGSIGLLLALRLRQHEQLQIADANAPRRRAIAARLPELPTPRDPLEILAARQKDPARAFDVILHASGNPQGLALALQALELEGRVIEVSWFGDQDVCLPLGADFHERRLTIRSSQVAHIAQGHDAAERRRAVLTMLLQEGALLDRLLGPDLAFEGLPTAMKKIYTGSSPFPLPVVRYPSTEDPGPCTA